MKEKEIQKQRQKLEEIKAQKTMINEQNLKTQQDVQKE
jgi:hypothetical protein